MSKKLQVTDIRTDKCFNPFKKISDPKKSVKFEKNEWKSVTSI